VQRFVRLFRDLSCLLLDSDNVQTAQRHTALVVKPHDDATPARIGPSVLRARNSITVTATGHNNERLERARCQMLTNIFNHGASTLRLRLNPGKPSQWLEAQSSRLLPVDYFLVTFTVPEGLRGWMRSQPQLGYDALFAASSRALLDLAANPRRLGAQLGMWGAARYVFQTATGNRRLTPLPDGRVLWKYRDSQTRQWQSMPLEKPELIRRFLQHVLPAGYHRVRRFGWLHPAAKTRRERVELLLGKAEITLADRAADPPLDAVEEEPFPKPANLYDPVSPVSAIRKTFTCPRCAKPMCWIGSVWRGCAGRRPNPARAPPPKS